ncbi:MAG: hypothetical protein ABWX96_19610 [Propionibacteriaceae bacterium]
MFKKLAASVTATLLLGSAMVASSPAAANAWSPAQTICSSKHSDRLFSAFKGNFSRGISSSHCYDVPKKVEIYITNSYRVAYNYGPYSECRTNNNFIPWQQASVIYFRTYNSYHC